MKLLKYFNSYLENTVNLNQSRLDDLDDRVKAITTFLQDGDHEMGRLFVQTIPQGSYAHRTIIKPVAENDEFDADLLLELEEDADWSPADYVQELYTSFRSSSVYRDMVSRRTRCVVVTYANRFHIDVVPYLERHGEHYITNRKTDEFELTNPEGFNAWLEEKNRVTGGRLVKVIRLVKYIRDYKNTFSVPSVILNILLGDRVNEAALLGDPEHYEDIPTTLKNVLAALNDYLQANPIMPTIADPSCPTESFNHRWSDDEYSNFRKWIEHYSTKVTEAFEETDKAESLAKWQEVFGTDFRAPEPSTAKSAALALGRARDTEQFLERDLGIPIRLDPRYVLRIVGRVRPRPGFRHYALRSQGNTVAKQRTIRFTIERCNVPKPYKVYWKVKNHGEEAIRADCIRGQIVEDPGLERKDEPTAYRGDHYVECYIVKNGVCVAMDRQPVIIR
jgi:hypothetical protein